MLVKLQLESVRETKWSEYATRFIFGGVVTVVAALIADHFGAAIGGLFLAFPAIFPASASLIQKHQREKKEKAGIDGVRRGRIAAAIDAVGATIGCFGLAAFAAVAWKLLPRYPLWLTLMISTLVWTGVAVTAWFVRKRARHQRILTNPS